MRNTLRELTKTRQLAHCRAAAAQELTFLTPSLSHTHTHTHTPPSLSSPPESLSLFNLLSVVSESLLLVEYFLLFFSLSICQGGGRGGGREGGKGGKRERKMTSEKMFTTKTQVLMK